MNHPLEIQADWTIRQVKEAFMNTLDFKTEIRKLIYKNDLLDKDEKLVKDYNITQGDFIVALVSKKAEPAPKYKQEPKEPKNNVEVKNSETDVMPQPEVEKPNSCLIDTIKDTDMKEKPLKTHYEPQIHQMVDINISKELEVKQAEERTKNEKHEAEEAAKLAEKEKQEADEATKRAAIEK